MDHRKERNLISSETKETKWNVVKLIMIYWHIKKKPDRVSQAASDDMINVQVWIYGFGFIGGQRTE